MAKPRKGGRKPPPTGGTSPQPNPSTPAAQPQAGRPTPSGSASSPHPAPTAPPSSPSTTSPTNQRTPTPMSTGRGPGPSPSSFQGSPTPPATGTHPGPQTTPVRPIPVPANGFIPFHPQPQPTQPTQVVTNTTPPWLATHPTLPMDLSLLTTSFPFGLNLSQACSSWFPQLGVFDMDDFVVMSSHHTVESLMKNLGVTTYFIHHHDLMIFLEFGKLCIHHQCATTPDQATIQAWIPTLIKNLRFAHYLYTYEKAEQLAQALLQSTPSPSVNQGSRSKGGR